MRFSIVQIIPNQEVGVSSSINRGLNKPSYGERGSPDHAGEHDVVAQFLVREK